MRSFDFSPLFRSTVGFDRLATLLDGAARLDETAGYPPYNIEKTGQDAYRITMAVAGFGPDDLTLTQQANALIVTGRRRQDDGAEYLHRGLVARPFERRFDLADFIKVTGADLQHGLLSIDLVREVPEAMKPRTIKIAGGEPVRQVTEQPAEAKQAA